jgi:chemotaxis protein methyltransferase CheR
MTGVGLTTRLPMSAEAFAELRALIYEHCGILVPEDNVIQLERALTPRLHELELDLYEEYLEVLRTRRAELDELAERVALHETYFYRDPDQLDAFRRRILPVLAERGALRVWSAGCSTGEEAYTVAMLVVDSGLYTGADVRIYGSDLSRRALATARSGIYGRGAFRALPPDLKRYFRDAGGDLRQKVRDDVRALVHFGHMNLMDSGTVSILGEVDVVFCRNVLMYFDLPARRRALEAIGRKLGRGGWLLVGHSEALAPEDGFERVPDLPAVYRKRETE